MTLLTRKEAARYLRVGLTKFRELRGLPVTKVGKRPFYAKEDLDQWLDTQKAGNLSGGAGSRVYDSRMLDAALTSPRAKEMLAKLQKSPRQSTRTSSRVA